MCGVYTTFSTFFQSVPGLSAVRPLESCCWGIRSVSYPRMCRTCHSVSPIVLHILLMGAHLQFRVARVFALQKCFIFLEGFSPIAG